MISFDIVNEPVSAKTFSISYTCLLIPRSPFQNLNNELSSHLQNWLVNICESKHWQIEFQTVREGYFQWGLRFSSPIQIGQFMKEIRTKTSELILDHFADLRDGPTTDFWAPGYLVVLGTRPHPQALIEHYIKLIRRQQGN